jgi:imidazolonepropionase-like amidohydrolase
MENVVLTNVTIIDCTGADSRPNAWVVIEGSRIKDVGEGSRGALPGKSQIIDCRGETLLPGLIECHVHVGSVDASV